MTTNTSFSLQHSGFLPVIRAARFGRVWILNENFAVESRVNPG